MLDVTGSSLLQIENKNILVIFNRSNSNLGNKASCVQDRNNKRIPILEGYIVSNSNGIPLVQVKTRQETADLTLHQMIYVMLLVSRAQVLHISCKGYEREDSLTLSISTNF